MKKFAVIQKCPSRTDYSDLFSDFIDYNNDLLEVFELSDVKVSRLLKRDITMDVAEFDPSEYDYVVLVGTEALKEFTDKTSITSCRGTMVSSKTDTKTKTFVPYDNYLVMMSPAAIMFKPEIIPDVEDNVRRLKDIVKGTGAKKRVNTLVGMQDTKTIVKHLRHVLDSPEYKTIALDTETTGLYARKCYVLGISMSHTEEYGCYMDTLHFDDLCVSLLQKIIDSRVVVFHNAKFDRHMLSHHFGLKFNTQKVTDMDSLKPGVPTREVIHDTMVMHYVLDERTGTHGLKQLAQKYTDLGNYDEGLDDFKKAYCKAHKISAEDFTYDLIPWDIIKDYACLDTVATLRLFNKFYAALEKNKALMYVYHNVLLPTSQLLQRIEDNGVPVSLKRLDSSIALAQSKVKMFSRQLEESVEVKRLEHNQGAIFNPQSPKQVRELLFTYCGLKPTGKLTGTGAICTDAEVLTELAEYHEVPRLISEVKKWHKLQNTFLLKMKKHVDADGCLRTNFNNSSTTSGRLSSSGTINLQQLPSRTAEGSLVKGCIKADDGWCILAKDMGTAEVFVAAALSEDRNLMSVFKNLAEGTGADVHSTVGHMALQPDCMVEEVKKLFPEVRQASKSITFSILYGSGPQSMADGINDSLREAGKVADCTAEDAQGYIDEYYRKFPGVKRWVKEMHDSIKTDGYVYSYFGRKRRLRNIFSPDRGVAAGEVRSGFNFLCQSTSSDILLLGAIDLQEWIDANDIPAKIIALVHDSIVVHCRKDYHDMVSEAIDVCIQTDRGLSCLGTPMGVDADSEDGGSEDYSCGKFAKNFPELAVL